MNFNRLLQVSSLSAVMLSTGFSTAASAASTDMQPMQPMQHGEMNQNQMNQNQMNHNNMSQETMNSSAMPQAMTGNQMFLEKKDIDGYTVSFHVMPAEEGMSHGGSHNLMIKVDKDGATVKGVQVNSKVVYPDGTEESKPLMAMGDWQMAGYDLKASGKHQLMVLFKTADGKKHFGGLHYGN
ncbi:hypothetical protein [Amphritea pacifica]|uniref:Copper resistance protein CopC n=1 Tax=Amphritea pacifica TaxID=2811233 RepID=A0ABS2W5T9_9GAMM|nr:hypothetical protein [Amphritea pacifica]MBN0987080.1 hypothetical protein [Amphritea pacifica]